MQVLSRKIGDMAMNQVVEVGLILKSFCDLICFRQEHIVLVVDSYPVKSEVSVRLFIFLWMLKFFNRLLSARSSIL